MEQARYFGSFMEKIRSNEEGQQKEIKIISHEKKINSLVYFQAESISLNIMGKIFLVFVLSLYRCVLLFCEFSFVKDELNYKNSFGQGARKESMIIVMMGSEGIK